MTFCILIPDPLLPTQGRSTFNPGERPHPTPPHSGILQLPTLKRLSSYPDPTFFPVSTPKLPKTGRRLFAPHSPPPSLTIAVAPPLSPRPRGEAEATPVPFPRLLAPDQGTSTPWGVSRPLGRFSPFSSTDTHSPPPRPPPPELPFESREPSHRAAGSSLASATEPGSGRQGFLG